MALAVLVTDPSSRSARVIEYDAVQVIEAGAPACSGWATLVALSSATLNGPASVTLPVFVTRKLYEITVPTVEYVEGVGVLTIAKARAWTAITVRLTVGEVVVPLLALAVLVSEPASRSAWVIVYEAAQVIEASGASVAVSGTGRGGLVVGHGERPGKRDVALFVTR